jgi:hypothetical protein
MRCHAHRRETSLILTLTLALGLFGAVSSAASAPCSGSQGGCREGTQHCQWITPAACCDQPLSVSGSSDLPKPAAGKAHLPPLREAGVAAWTPEHASAGVHPVFPATLVLRL